MNKNYVTRNIHVLSIKGDFKLFHDYIFDCDLFSNDKKCRFDITDLSKDDKIIMLADCIYELSIIKNKLKTTNESFKFLEENEFKDMYIDISEVVNILKPYVLESDFLHEMKIRNYFRAVFDDSVPKLIKQQTKDEVILSLLDFFYVKDKEYETKANFYTAAENKIVEKHYTEETWFKVGLKYADGTIYNLKADNPKLSKNKITIRIFGLENVKTFQPMLSQSFDGYKVYKKDCYDKDNIYNRSTSKEELKKVYNYCVENNISLNTKFIENYLLVQES